MLHEVIVAIAIGIGIGIFAITAIVQHQHLD